MPSTTGIRCGRCDKGFRSHRAKQQHIQDSDNHQLCGYCINPTDYETEEDLDNHLEKAHHICTSCNYQGFGDAHRLAQHNMDKHNICIVCRRSFQTRQNLKMVSFCTVLNRLTSRKADIYYKA
jgi:glycerol-3-phosphate dehydrogenase